MRRGCKLLVVVLGLLVLPSLAPADVVALKRSSATIYAAQNLDQVFRDAVSGGTIAIYTDASTGQDMVDDTCLYFVNNYEKYKNRGSVQKITADNGSLWKFNVSVLPQFVGGRVVKANLQLYFTGGYSTPTFGRVTSTNWSEGNKSGDYPGLAPASAGASPAHPNGLNTNVNQDAAGGTTGPLTSWGPTHDQWFSLAGDVSGLQYGGNFWAGFTGTPYDSANSAYDGYARMDIAPILQDWADGLPNYGMYTDHGNRGFTFAEAAGQYEPILFIEYTRNETPMAVADLGAANADWFRMDLTWTAPDDRPSGAVASYDIRYSTTTFPTSGTAQQKADWFAAATQVADEPTPLAAGTAQGYTVLNLSASTTYWFAIRSVDRTGLVSDIAAVSGTTNPMDATAPAAVTLSVGYTGPNHVVLNWTAPGDDNNTGTANLYDIRYSTSLITGANFGSATQVPGAPIPAAAGIPQSVRITGLENNRQYWFAIKTRDEVPNWSGISNVPTTTTLAPDTQAPSAVSDLAVIGVHINSAYLKWTTPADIGAAGLASYEIRYSTSAITAGNWSSATLASNTIVPGATGSEATFQVLGLNPDTVYFFAVKSSDLAVPANTSAVSNSPSGRTLKPVRAIALTNPWIVNDRVADCRNITTIGATFQKAYTPDGVVNPASDEDKAINIYNNIKRRIYHWAQVPPECDDITYNVNVFGWALCGHHQTMGCTVARAAGLTARGVGINEPPYGGHNIYEVQYGDGTWHLYDTMTTMYVYNRASPPKVASAGEIAADRTIMTQSQEQGRACPGYLLCGDDEEWFATGLAGYSTLGITSKSNLVMNMNLGMGQALKRTWESWDGEHVNTQAPFHHESANDWKDTVNNPYWEPYFLGTADNNAIGISYSKTYRRWANGTFAIEPDFRSAGYQATLHSSANIRTWHDDNQTPDLRPAAVDTPAEVVFRVNLPFYCTDAFVSGTFFRNDAYDVNKIYYSPDDSNWVQVWDNGAIGTTQLSNLSLRGYVNARSSFYIKVLLQANGAISQAGVSDFKISVTYEHNKGGMAYLDKGANNLTLSFDNPDALVGGGGAIHVVYKWKEYDGAAWTIDRTFERYFDETDAYPYTFSINVGGTKVPKTEYILLEVTDPPQPDTIAPAQIDDLSSPDKDSTFADLAWTATGDDYLTGTASRYEIRYTTGATAMNAATWPTATLVSGTPSPALVGSAEQFRVTSLTGSTTYHFAIKAFDEDDNASPLSNVVNVTTDPPDVTAPGTITNLDATRGTGQGQINLTWTAPGDDGSVGTADAYDLRYSTSTITAGNFASATPITGIGAPKAPGQAEAYTVTLPTGVVYYFAIKTRDEVPLWSALSNVADEKSVLGEIVLQQGLDGYNGCVDTYIQEANPTTNYDAYNFMRLTGFNAPNRQRGLIKFDLAGIPASATITRATLYLYANGVGIQTHNPPGNYAMHRTYERWTAAEATWTNSKSGTAWTVAGGGGFSPTPNALSPKQAAAGWYPFDVTSVIQFLIANPDYNFGFLLKCEDETYHNQDQFWASSYATDTSMRPKLVITDLEGFAVTTAGSPTPGGTVSGGGTYASGQTCTLTASPSTAYGYTFTRWQGGPVDGQTANPVSFTVTGDTSVTAVFTGPAGFIDVGTFAELQSAMASAVAGNTIRVHPGTYTITSTSPGKIIAGNSGTSSQPIRILGISDAGGNRPVMTASCDVQRFFEFEPTDNWWVVENLEFRHLRGTNNPWEPVATSVYIRGDNITMRNCKVTDCDFGIFPIIDADNCTIEYCEVSNCGSLLHPVYGHCIYFQANSGTVRGCYIHNESGYGMCLKTRANNGVFEYNWLGPEGGDTGDYVCNVASRNNQNQLWRGNVIVKRTTPGGQRRIISIYDSSDESLYGTVTFLNNTVISALAEDTHLFLVGDGASAVNDAVVVLKNNIFAGPATTFLQNNVQANQLAGNNNVLMTTVTVPSQLTATTVLSACGFVNAGAGDYHLAVGSGCIGVGQNNPTYLNSAGQWVAGAPTGEPTKVLAIDTRFTDAAIDAGAYEYHPPVPSVAFDQPASSGAESTTGVNIPVSLSAAHSAVVTVDYAVTGGSATGGGTDYTLAAGQLTFNIGVTTQNIPVTINNDALDEDDETLVITLSNPVQAVIGANSAHTYTITDNDNPPTVQFTATTSQGAESATAVNLAVNLSAASGKTVTVNYAVTGGSATSPADYTISGTQLTFSAGETSKNVPITVVDDAASETGETIEVTLSSPANASLGTNTAHTYTILDNEQATVQFQVTSSSGGEGTSPANLVVTLNQTCASDVTVQYNVTGGTATLNSDYQMASAPSSDIIALKRDAGLTAGGVLDSRFISLTGADVVTTTVSDARIWFQLAAAYMNYGAHTEVTSYYAGTDGLFHWDLSAYAGATVNKAQLRVKATQGNTTGLWYAGIKTSAWAEGNKTGDYPGVAPAAPGATWNHPNGTYTYSTGPFGWGAAGNAAFDETADTGDVYTHYAFSSEPVGLAFLVADVTGLVQDWVSGAKPNYGLLTWTGNHGLYASEAGSADQPVLFLDYSMQAATNVVTIPAGQLSATIPITILQDSTIEDNETIQVTLSNPVNATLGASTVHTYTITNDDFPSVQFSTTSSSGSEGTTSVNLQVTLSQSSPQTVTVNYAATGGTAASPADYTLGGAQVTFTPGQTTQSVPITVVDDSTGETDETIQVTLSSPANATLGANTVHTYTITDNDMPLVQFQTTSSSGSEANRPVSLTVTLSYAAGSDVTVDYVGSGSAVQDTDYIFGAADTIALKRSAGLTAGGALDSRFAALAGGNVVTTTVRDARLYDQGNGRYMNYGTSTSVAAYYAGTHSLWWWDLANYSGATIAKAELRLSALNGNATGLWYAGVKTHAWAEGNKNGDYPGKNPLAAGVCWMHPNGTYTKASGTGGWGPTANAAFNNTADTGDVFTHYAFSSEPSGVGYLVADVTALVQDWVAGTKSNYGVYAWTGNHGLDTSEATADKQPVLFVDYSRPVTVQRVTIPAGQTSATVPLGVTNDALTESAETVVVTLSNPAGAMLGTNTVHTYTITDND